MHRIFFVYMNGLKNQSVNAPIPVSIEGKKLKIKEQDLKYLSISVTEVLVKVARN